MNNAFDIIAILIGLTALFGWMNHRYIRLPMTIGMLVFALVASLLIAVGDALYPGYDLTGELAKLLKQVDFTETLMKGLLGFLLFAGALHVDLHDMRRRVYSITLMATDTGRSWLASS